MSEGTDYESILDRTWDSIEEPGLIPAGPWLLRGVQWTSKVVTPKDGGEDDKYEQVSLCYEPFKAQDGVDAEAVEANKFEGRRIWVRRNMSDPQRIADFKKLITKHGLSMEGRTVKQTLAGGFKGSLIYGNVKVVKKTNQDTKEEYLDNDIDKFAAVD